MNHLKELPPGTVWPHLLEAIERDALADLRQYADNRISDVARGAETPELAALLVDKYCDGIAKALQIVGIDSTVRVVGDRLVRAIDGHFEYHRQLRRDSRPAGVARSEVP